MIRNLVFALAVCTFASGCYTTRVYFNRDASGTVSNSWDGRWYHNVLYGLYDLSDGVDVEQACPSGLAYAEQKISFLNGVVSGILYNLYNPHTVTLYCAAGGTAQR